MSNFLAFDTSNYTTSAAVFNDDGYIVKKSEKVIPVQAGCRGVRQSDAVFLHIKAFPEIMEKLSLTDNVLAVGASDRPSSEEGSYMPCFSVGTSFAGSFAQLNGIPFYSFTHQQGHAYAAILSSGRVDMYKKPFLAFHVSGGTTDLVHFNGLETRKIATSLDLHAGQLVDRAGVLLGLGFPCGIELEKLAMNGALPENPKPCIKDGSCALSGFENKIKALIQKGCSPEDVSLYTLACIGRSVRAIIDLALEKYSDMPVLFVGGVMSNRIIRERYLDGLNAVFGPPEYSRDNAAGIAYLTYLKHKNEI